jgi:uncharacterized membrane protein
MAMNESVLTHQGEKHEETQKSKIVNVGSNERLISAIGGGALAVYGLTRGTFGGIVLGLVGGALVYRGVTGHCDTYEAMNVNTAREGARGSRVSVPGNRGIKVEKSVTVNRSASEL